MVIKTEVDKKVDNAQKRLTRKVDNTLKVLKLTKTEKEVLHLLTDEFLTSKQISYRRKCSRQAVHKILKKLKEKGAYNSGLEKVDKSDPLVNQNSKTRLHGQEFNIKIIWQDQKYQEILEKSNIVFLDSNTIRLYRNSIEIYSGQSFFADNEQVATSKSLEYWKRFFARMEHDFKVIIVKPRSTNIRLVNQHYASTNSEISESAIERGERIRIFAQEDGKLAFITDDSFGFKEDEAVHPITAKQDRKAIDKQVNDWRLNNPPTNSELAQISMENAQGQKKVIEVVNILTDAQKGLPETMQLFAQQIQSHLKLIQEYREENILWRKETEKKIRESIKPKDI